MTPTSHALELAHTVHVTAQVRQTPAGHEPAVLSTVASLEDVAAASVLGGAREHLAAELHRETSRVLIDIRRWLDDTALEGPAMQPRQVASHRLTDLLAEHVAERIVEDPSVLDRARDIIDHDDRHRSDHADDDQRLGSSSAPTTR